MEDPKATQRRAWLAAERAALVVMLVLLAALAALWWTRRGDWRQEPGAPTGQYLSPIDPNTADWQALECLPGIGEVRAKAIVAYRRQSARQPAFTQPDDLRHVRGRGVPGIGAKTIERITPFLAFPPASAPDR